jgi:hypothetical protein
MDKNGKISIKWAGSSVSGLVVIAGIIALTMGNASLAQFLIVLGLIGAIFMTLIINVARRL